MSKLRIGVWIGNEGYKPEAGGGFGYRSQLIEKLSQADFADTDIIFISNNKNKVESDRLNYYRIKWRKNRFKRIQSGFNRWLSLITPVKKWRLELKSFERKNRQKLYDELNSVVDIIYYPTPECIYPDFPFIYTLWDSGHLSTYAFPEVVFDGELENRMSMYEVLHKAFMIFAESEAGKKEIEYYYRINPDRIQVIPIFPSQIIEKTFLVSRPNQLSGEEMFIHYPAQFWAHKNHYNLILAFKIVQTTFPTLKLVLTGSEKGNKRYIFSLIQELELIDSVIDLGFVSMETLKWLYLNSKGLVMPTFLGPTNMPLLEAAELGCPVACSNLKGQQEQLGEYGYYFDPKNPTEMAEVIIQMLNDKIEGVEKPYRSIFNINNALLAIEKAFQKARNVRFTWE